MRVSVPRSLRVGAAVLFLAGASGCGTTQDHVLGQVAGARVPQAATAAPVAQHPDLTGRKVPVDNYASSVCVGLDQFGLDYAAARDKRATAMAGSPGSAQVALLGYYDSLDQAFDRMATAVRRSGIPELENGDAMAAGVVSTLGEARQAGDHHRPEVAALPTTDTRKFRPAANRIVHDSDRDVASAMRKLGRFDADPRFRQAFDQSRTCPHR